MLSNEEGTFTQGKYAGYSGPGDYFYQNRNDTWVPDDNPYAWTGLSYSDVYGSGFAGDSGAGGTWISYTITRPPRYEANDDHSYTKTIRIFVPALGTNPERGRPGPGEGRGETQGDGPGWWDSVKAWFSEDGHDSPQYKAYMADRAADPEFYEKWDNVGLTLGIFLPGGGLGSLFRLGATKSVAVIGPRATYREFGKNLGANFLNVSDDAWTWEKNLKFLEGVVSRGDDVIFAGKFNPAKLDASSTLAREINYLIQNGYKWTDDFTKLIK